MFVLCFNRYPQLPCIDIGKQSYLPMELCKTEISHKKNLTEQQTADIIKETATKAIDRMNYIDRWAQKSEIHKDPILREYNIDVKLKMIELNGRVLEAPDIGYNKLAGNLVTSRTIAQRGSWDHRNFQFANSVKIERWVILNLARIKEDQAWQFAEMLVRIGKIHGIQIKPLMDYKSSRPRPSDEDVRRLIDDTIVKYHSRETKLDLIVIILGMGGSSAYKVLKTQCDLKYGIPTQAVEEKNVYKLSDQTISNILLKINTKCGGRNFMLSPTNRL